MDEILKFVPFLCFTVVITIISRSSVVVFWQVLVKKANKLRAVRKSEISMNACYILHATDELLCLPHAFLRLDGSTDTLCVTVFITS